MSKRSSRFWKSKSLRFKSERSVKNWNYESSCWSRMCRKELWENKRPHLRFRIQKFINCQTNVQESRREGWTDARSAVGFCLGSDLFGSYNSD